MSGQSPELDEWSTALAFLREAEQCPATAVPRMTVYAAYYAVFHGARAVLVKLDGRDAAKKHNPVVGRFGYHAKAANDATLMAAGKLLNTAQELRELSDYGTGPGPQPTAAATLVLEGRRFLETCARVHGFPSP